MGGAYRTGLMGILLSAGLLAGCGDSGSNPGPQPTTIRITPSAVSFDAVGATATLTVQVLDQDGTALPGAAVTWSSDDQGVATVTTAGIVTSRGNGTAHLSARSGDAVGTTTVTVAQVGEALAESGGADQVGPAGVALSMPLQVRATDRLGAVAVGVPVTFEVTEGEGSVSPATAATDAQGVASSIWTLGPDASGSQRVRSRLSSGDFVDFTADAVPGPPDALAVVTGDQQTAPRSTALTQPLTLRVADAFDNPVAGATVDFAVTAGTGSVSPTTTQTDADGNAAAAWTLGPEIGEQSVEATVGDVHLAFTATATTEPAALELSGGQSQTATVASDVPVAPTVRVLDAADLPVPGVEVTFRVTAGGGSVAAGAAAPPGLSDANGDEITVQTDDQGEASAVWTLGTGAGAQSLEASVANVGSVVFNAQATAGAPASLTVVSGDAQSGAPASTLAQAVVVEVDDGFGNPVQGVSVGFAVTGGGGSLTPASVTTGPDGRAAASWTLGPSNGPQAGEATAGDLQATFSATAQTVPAALVILAGNGQDVTVGTDAVPPSVRVDDAGGNRLGGVTVTFQVTQGTSTLTEGANSGTAVTAVTDASGIATLDAWSIGTVAGVQQVTVSVSGVAPRIVSATARAGAAAAFVKVSGDGQTGPASSSLPQPVVVRVEDTWGNPKSGVSVTFTPGSGSVLPASSVTNAQGQAQTLWTLGSSQGTQFLSATTGGLAPLNFSATATPGGGGAYSIELQYLTAVPASQQTAFESAANRWSGIITGDLPDVSMTADGQHVRGRIAGHERPAGGRPAGLHHGGAHRRGRQHPRAGRPLLRA